jgi:hypothetical protein
MTLTTNQASDVTTIGRMWYHAALFCLERAEFMRVPSLCTVQAVAVLSMCFNLYGDADLGHHMRSSAIRVGQRIGLNKPCSPCIDNMSADAQNRLWWTLTICEWYVFRHRLVCIAAVLIFLSRLNVPYQRPQIDEADFDVPLPSPTNPLHGTAQVDAVHYHAFMARTALVYHRFCQSVTRGSTSVPDDVRAADDELAQVIETLPSYLQPDFTGAGRDGGGNDDAFPWLEWQRFDITLVLLHHRIRINRTLQRQWLANPEEFVWARSISVRSALDIIWISKHWDQPLSQRKQW